MTIASPPHTGDHGAYPAHRSNHFKRFFQHLRAAAKEWMNDNAMRLSAALSLYTLLSLAPLLVLTLKVLGVVLRNKEAAGEQIVAQLNNLMGFQASSVIQPILENSAKPSEGVFAAAISIIILLFSATGVFVELQASMNTIWHVKPPTHAGISGFVRHRLLSAVMVLGIGFLLLTSMFVSTLLTTLLKYFMGDAWIALYLVDIVVSVLVISGLFAAIFKVLPDIPIPWSSVWRGALLSGAMFTLGKYLLALYFKYASPASAYGAAGTLAAVMIWVYYSSFILFFGAEYARVSEGYVGEHPKPG